MSTTKWIFAFAFTIFVSVALWLVIGLLPYWAHHSHPDIGPVQRRGLNLKNYPDLAEAGQFGDSFGFANALFSALAFGFVALALLLQLQQLKAQMQEIRDAARMHEASQRQMTRQTEISGYQALSEFYRSKQERETSPLERHKASGVEAGYIRKLEEALLASDVPDTITQGKALIMSDFQLRLLRREQDYRECRDFARAPNGSLTPVHEVLYDVAEDMSFIQCFPSSDFGFTWDVATVLSQIAMIINESDIDPTFEGGDRLRLIVENCDQIFAHIRQMSEQCFTYQRNHAT